MEKRFSHIKDWTRHFFVSGSGWEYPKEKAVHQEFLVHAIWGIVLNDIDISITQSEWEENRLATVQAWALYHPDDVWTDTMLTEANIFWYLISPDWSYVLGRRFLRESSASQR